MEISSHTYAPVELAAVLVNALTPGERRGSPYALPAGAAQREAVAEALHDRPNRARTWAEADEDEMDRLAVLAPRWRAVFEAAGEDPDRVAHLVNALLTAADVRPVLANHDDEAWHLHAHDEHASPAGGLAALCALGFATLVAAGGTDRLGVCAASHCDRVYVDVSRNLSRRYCSSACQGRAKTAAFRARRA